MSAENVNVEVLQDDGGVLVLRVDLEQRLRKSTTGKTMIVAEATDKLPAPFDHVGFSLYVYTKQGVGP